MAVAIDRNISSAPLAMPFPRQSLRQFPILVVHSAPLSELGLGEQDTRLYSSEILAGWNADYSNMDAETFLLTGPPLNAARRGSLRGFGQHAAAARLDRLGHRQAVLVGHCP